MFELREKILDQMPVAIKVFVSVLMSFDISAVHEVPLMIPFTTNQFEKLPPNALASTKC